MKRLLPIFLIILFANLHGLAFAQTLEPTQPQPAPIGQVIKLDFRLPGIGSESGNLKPLHATRDVTLFFFARDVNSQDVSVKPLASFKTQAVYGADSQSPNFGSFVNANIDLAAKIPDGTYQISFKTNQTLPELIKEKKEAIGGKIFEIHKSYGQPIIISNQTVISGDIYPTGGDNIMDIKDSNALNDCFGSKADSPGCPDKAAADLDDNGVVDGTDYNIMFSSFKILLNLGYPVPSIFASPTKTISKPTVRPTVAVKKDKPNAKKLVFTTNFASILFVLFIFIDLGVGLFLFLKHKNKKQPIDRLSEKTSVPTDIKTEAIPAEEKIDKEFFVKKQADDPDNKRIVLTLTDDNGPTLGYYAGKDVKEGFAQVKGVMKKEGNKVFIEVTEITPEQESAA